jgi:uncharacterized SAM-dependent methyltransferase
MNFLRNADIASEYRVSTTTVLNWIESAVIKKNNLQVELNGKKYKITDNAHNRSVLANLSSQASIYKNKTEIKKTKIHPDLYKFLTEEQLVELINRIELNKTVPLKFTYLGKGADSWDNFIIKSQVKGGYLPTAKIPELLRKSLSLILERIPENKKVNIVDLGTGSSESMLETTKFFHSKGLLNSYIGVDISSGMLSKSKKSILSIDKNIKYVDCELDFEKNDFAKTLFDQKDDGVINLVFFIEVTLGNAENINRTLENFKLSLAENDILIITNKIDNIEMRTQFEPVNRDSPHIWLTQYLGFDTDECELVTIYEDKSSRRKGYFILDKDYEIEFEIGGKTKTINLYKNSELVFWYHRMSEKNKIFDELSSAGLTLLDFTTTNDQNFLLAICQAQR